jgi:hypothetical protein
MCTIGVDLHVVRIDLLNLHLMPGRKSTFMLQCRDVARDYKSSTTSEADDQCGHWFDSLSIDLFGKSNTQAAYRPRVFCCS